MPFPWKKVKNTKISQLVSDHLESQRRQRGHLVVETGFPTSLIDLFVKNRDRLKKPKSSKKKKKAQNIDDSSPFPSSSPLSLYQGPRLSPSSSPSISRTPSSSSLALTPAVSSSSLAVNNRRPSSSSLTLTPDVSSSLLAVNEGMKKADEVHGNMNEGPIVKGVFGAILRMFFVVVLALGAKKFAVGLTMSASLLFLVEHVGKNSCRLLVPCSVVKRRLRLIMQSIYQVISFEDKSFDENYGSCTGIKGQSGASSEFINRVDNGPTSEIQIAQPMSMEDIQGPRKEIGESSFGSSELQFEKEFDQLERLDSKLMVVEETEVKEGCDISESKKGNSKRPRMKLKMKHLVPRKLRGPKKDKRDFEGETRPINQETVAFLEKPQEIMLGDARRNLECDSNLSLSSMSRRQDEDEQITMIYNSGVVCGEILEQIVIGEDQVKEIKGNSGYLILCLIVLIGLVGGRIIAFMFMGLWFLILKSGEKLRRFIKLPVIRSLTEKSC